MTLSDNFVVARKSATFDDKLSDGRSRLPTEKNPEVKDVSRIQKDSASLIKVGFAVDPVTENAFNSFENGEQIRSYHVTLF